MSPLQVALVERIDGQRSISEIIDSVVGGGAFARSDRGDIEATALETFRSLWQQDFVALGIRARRP